MLKRKASKYKSKKKNPNSSSIEHLQIKIEEEWDNKSIKTDWLQIETNIRDVFKFLDKNEISKNEALTLIARIIEAYTKRGEVAGY